MKLCCDCGNDTFYRRVSGEAECARCGKTERPFRIADDSPWSQREDKDAAVAEDSESR